MKIKTIMIIILGFLLSGSIALSFAQSYHWSNLGMDVDFWYVTILPLVLFTVGISIVLVLFYKSYSKTLQGGIMMRDETKGILFIMLAFFGILTGIVGAASILYSYFYGIDRLIAGIPFWICCVISFSVVYLMGKRNENITLQGGMIDERYG